MEGADLREYLYPSGNIQKKNIYLHNSVVCYHVG